MAGSEEEQAAGAGGTETNTQGVTVRRLHCLELHIAITIERGWRERERERERERDTQRETQRERQRERKREREGNMSHMTE